MVSAAAFVGLPLASSLFGSTGVFFTTIYMTCSRIFMWGPGLRMFPDAKKGNAIISVLTNPNTIAMYLAIIVYFILPFKLPTLVLNIVDSIGNTSTMFCMVLVGSMISKISLKDFGKKEIWYFCAIRLVAVPMLLFFVLKVLNANNYLICTMTLLDSAPASPSVRVMANKYGGDGQLAATIILVSTVISAVTIPLIALLYI